MLRKPDIHVDSGAAGQGNASEGGWGAGGGAGGLAGSSAMRKLHSSEADLTDHPQLLSPKLGKSSRAGWGGGRVKGPGDGGVGTTFTWGNRRPYRSGTRPPLACASQRKLMLASFALSLLMVTVMRGVHLPSTLRFGGNLDCLCSPSSYGGDVRAWEVVGWKQDESDKG